MVYIATIYPSKVDIISNIVSLCNLTILVLISIISVMEEKINLVQTDDFFARYLFSNKGNEDILLDFVNAVRKDAGETTFNSLELLDTFNLKENILERQTIVDARARTSSNEEIIVEIQSTGNIKYIPRILAYIAIAYVKQLNVDLETIVNKKLSKIDYTLLKPVISINILDFILRPNDPKMHSIYRLQDIESYKELTSDWEIHLIELKKSLNVNSQDLMLWVKFFTSKNLEADRIMITKEKPIFNKVFDSYERFKGDKKLMKAYREGQAYMASQIDMLTQERIDEKMEIAKNMLAEGYSIDDISKVTKLSIKEISSLEK